MDVKYGRYDKEHVFRQRIAAKDNEIPLSSVFAATDVDIGRPQPISAPIESWDPGLPIGTKIIVWRSILVVLRTF